MQHLPERMKLFQVLIGFAWYLIENVLKTIVYPDQMFLGLLKGKC